MKNRQKEFPIRKFLLPVLFFTMECKCRQLAFTTKLDHFYNSILIKFTAVNGKMILGQICPFPVSKVFIVGATFLVYFFEQLLSTFFFTACAFYYSLGTLIIGSINKYTETIILQDMIGTSAYNDTIPMALTVFSVRASTVRLLSD